MIKHTIRGNWPRKPGEYTTRVASVKVSGEDVEIELEAPKAMKKPSNVSTLPAPPGEARFRVTHYVPSAPRGQHLPTVWFDTYEEALAFFETANLACLFDGEEKLAESLRNEQ
jgi:hypothetical protein